MRKVFISSTYEDLKDHRQAVAAALRRNKLEVLGMEDFGSRPAPVLSACADEIGGCDIFIGIYAWRYGWVPQGSQTSITEQEFDHAQASKKKCLCYLASDTFPWEPALMEFKAMEALERFKEKVRNAVTVRCKQFTYPEALAGMVVTDVLGELSRLANEGVKEQEAGGGDEQTCGLFVRKSPIPDLDYSVERADYLAAINRALSVAPKPGLKAYNVCLLYGESGSGKSTLVKEFFEADGEADKAWIMCRSVIKPPGDLGRYRLVVLDGLQKHSWFFAGRPELAPGARVIATTSDRALAVRTLEHLGRADVEDEGRLLIQVRGLEAGQWERVRSARIPNGFSYPGWRELHGIFHGSPLALQLLTDVVTQQGTSQGFETALRSKLSRDPQLPYTTLLERWLNADPNQAGLLLTLSTVPFLGMTTTALSFTLVWDAEKVETVLASLLKKAFVQVLHCGDRQAWSPTDSLRAALHGFRPNDRGLRDIDGRRERYAAYLQFAEPDFLGKLDSLVVRVSRLFTRARNYDQGDFREAGSLADNFCECIEAIERLLDQEADTDLWAPLAAALAERSRACHEVLPVAIFIGYLRPPHKRLGDLAWGLLHDNYWANAVCVYTAVRHWYGSGWGSFDEEVERLRNLFEEGLAHGWSKSHTESDLEPATILGGLCLIGAEELAYDLLNSADYRRAFRDPIFSHLVVLVRLAEAGWDRRREELIQRHWARIRAGVLKDVVADYLEEKLHGPALSKRGPAWEPAHDYSVTLAQATFSGGFMEFVRMRIIDHGPPALLGGYKGLPLTARRGEPS